jgi:tRNA uridine 5-carboxymethylaminomethyl modification enzyme
MFHYPKRYEVIVVGGGHAGIEASLAAARVGCKVLLLTANADTIGQMSCNPAIGGSAKGHLVREVDALGGEMGRNADLTGIQFRMLNKSRGPAIWSPRAQCDKKAYQFRLKWVCEREPNLDVKQGQAACLETNELGVCGVVTSLGVSFTGQTVIITTGTFLHGLLHIGNTRQDGGRLGDAASVGLSASLRELGLELGRLKTGTPPRLIGRTIDFSKMEEQPGDKPVPLFSFWPYDSFHVEHSDQVRRSDTGDSSFPKGSLLERTNRQLSCFLTRTTQTTKEVVERNLHLSPMYSGQISSVGPRYCPSIEDKIVRFAAKDSHQVFLEPEGVNSDEYYVNGLSTSLPFEVQYELVRSVIGCESAEILRPAYAVEYDYVFPTQLLPSLETKVCRNLYLAGQINGTSGYEEAAAQGIVAGINAARRVRSMSPIVLDRTQAYIGVLIDDLVTLGTTEPYRIFTSRAELRLLLRQDNADLRLAETGHEVGLLPDRHFELFTHRRDAIRQEIKRLNETRFGTETLAHILRRSEISYESLPTANLSLSEEMRHTVQSEIKYQGYVDRQMHQASKAQSLKEKRIPVGFDYAVVTGLSTEGRQKLMKLRPESIGQASRISGVTQADLSLLLVWLKRYAKPTNNSVESPNRTCES